MATDTSTTNFVPRGFILVERLGIGSVFEVAVVRGEDGRDGRDLICKRSAPHVRAGVALERERDVLQAVRSPHLPELVASGSDASGIFVVQTTAPGTPLRRLLEEGTRLESSRWLALAQAGARALAALHAQGDAEGDLQFAHGDVSPDNLFWEAPNTVTFVDLSSATWRGAPRPALSADRGTAPYSAPELLRQEVQTSAECDTYAFAATLLTLAIGRSIVQASTEAARLLEAGTRGVRWDLLEQCSDLPAYARSALAEALQYRRVERLTSSGELARRLAGP